MNKRTASSGRRGKCAETVGVTTETFIGEYCASSDNLWTLVFDHPVVQSSNPGLWQEQSEKMRIVSLF